jgi:hypothetical protein
MNLNNYVVYRRLWLTRTTRSDGNEVSTSIASISRV